jgi:hypothetical protein
MGQNDHVERTGRYLALLLRQSGSYRSRWERRAQRLGRGDRINYDAVGRVLADYLAVHGDGSGADHRGLNDTVRRALTGELLSARTLEIFTEAFEMQECDTARLYALFQGLPNPRVVSGDFELPRGLTNLVGRAAHRTLQLNESHVIGADGIPATHETLQVIEATADGVTNFPCRFDTKELTFELLWGGTASDVFELGGGLYGVDVELNRSLNVGETANLRYRLNFYYSSAPETWLRHGARSKPIRNLSLRVQFHRNKLPGSLWWAVWDEWSSQPVTRDPVELDANLSAHRMLDEVQNAIVGFSWEW